MVSDADRNTDSAAKRGFANGEVRNLPATARTVADLIEEYDEKNAAIEDVIQDFEDAHKRLETAATVQGFYAGSVCNRPNLHASTLRRNLLKSGWRAVYNRLNIAEIASATDKRLFERAIEDPAPLTFDNAKATFGDYLLRPRYHILRGLAETFCALDPAYRSHSKVKIGVKGLPKRIILTSVGSYSSYGRDRLKDVLSALAAVKGQPIVEHAELSGLDSLNWCGEHRAGEVVIRDLTVKKFQNGNAHVFFDTDTLLQINQALAEFYGDVLPDAEPEDVRPSASTAVSKDLQFYWSPQKVVEAACDYAGLHTKQTYSGTPPVYRVLEPSCGDGRIMDEARRRGNQVLGFEYHPGRAAEARAKGHSVVTGNFLEQPPRPEFDRVVMNPPFYGRHYVKHVRHALKFLKPGGVLVSVLPATAHYDHGELKGQWQDLPVGSFSEAGTNVPTGLLKMAA